MESDRGANITSTVNKCKYISILDRIEWSMVVVQILSGLEKEGSLNRGISNEGSVGNQHNSFFIIKFRNSIQVKTIQI